MWKLNNGNIIYPISLNCCSAFYRKHTDNLIYAIWIINSQSYKLNECYMFGCGVWCVGMTGVTLAIIILGKRPWTCRIWNLRRIILVYWLLLPNRLSSPTFINITVYCICLWNFIYKFWRRSWSRALRRRTCVRTGESRVWESVLWILVVWSWRKRNCTFWKIETARLNVWSLNNTVFWSNI